MNRSLPLSMLYLQQAAWAWTGARYSLPLLLDSPSTFPLPPFLKEWQERLQNLEDPTAFQNQVMEEIASRWQKLSQGITTYLSHTHERPKPEANLIWTAGTTQVWDYAPEIEGPILLLIPSLVNKAYILDLAPQCSLIHYLKEQGYRPWLIDWQAPGEEESQFDLNDYILQRLLPILQQAYAKNSAPLKVLGYCMGGIMALGMAQKTLRSPLFDQFPIEKLVLLATPWDFSKTNFGYSEQAPSSCLFTEWSNQINNTLKQQSLPPFPEEVIQFYFHSQSPLTALQKFDAFADLDPFSGEAIRFVQLEEWVNDGIPLSAPTAINCFNDWVTLNSLEKEMAYLGEDLFDPSLIPAPILLAMGQKDTIVPMASTLALNPKLLHSTLQDFPLGHVGLTVGKKAPELSWKFISNWLQ